MNPPRGIPWTRLRLAVARGLYTLVRLGLRSPRHVIRRRGITYDVDLREGLDLALFLFGGAQKDVQHLEGVHLPEDAVIMDVGANFGVMTLSFAHRVPRGRVLAFEPTHYAWRKLQRNIELNPDLAPRIWALQCFVSDRSAAAPALSAYASWPVDRRPSTRAHEVHGGEPQDTEGIPSTTLDEVARNQGLERLDLIKIDTDGHELAVLRGAREVIGRFRPAVVFEVGGYLMAERGLSFADYVDFFRAFGYDVHHPRRSGPLGRETGPPWIPPKGTVDLIARPRSSRRAGTGPPA